MRVSLNPGENSSLRIHPPTVPVFLRVIWKRPWRSFSSVVLPMIGSTPSTLAKWQALGLTIWIPLTRRKTWGQADRRHPVNIFQKNTSHLQSSGLGSMYIHDPTTTKAMWGQNAYKWWTNVPWSEWDLNPGHAPLGSGGSQKTPVVSLLFS